MTVALAVAALLVSLLTALGAAAIARRVRLLELQSDNSIRVLRPGASAAPVSVAAEAFLQDAERSLVLSASGSCWACRQVVDQHLGQVDLPAAVATVVVQPEDDRISDQQRERLRQLGWSLRTVDHSSFLALSAGAYPSMLLSEDHGRALTYLGPVGDPSLLDRALQAALDRTGAVPQPDP